MGQPDKPANFRDDLARSKQYDPQVRRFLARILGSIGHLEYLNDISNTSEGMTDDIDWRFKWISGEIPMSLEVKINDSGESSELAKHHLLVEVLSDKQRETDGWLWKSRANYLCYVWPDNEEVDGCILNLPVFREFYSENRSKYESHRMIEKQNTSWVTGFYTVPWKDVPKDCILYQSKSVKHRANCGVCNRN